MLRTDIEDPLARLGSLDSEFLLHPHRFINVHYAPEGFFSQVFFPLFFFQDFEEFIVESLSKLVYILLGRDGIVLGCALRNVGIAGAPPPWLTTLHALNTLHRLGRRHLAASINRANTGSSASAPANAKLLHDSGVHLALRLHFVKSLVNLVLLNQGLLLHFPSGFHKLSLLILKTH